MRILVALILSGALMMGCSDDSNTGGTAGGGTGGTAGAGGGGTAGTGGGGTAGTGGGGTAGTGGAPAGLQVVVDWVALLPCAMSTPSDYEVTVGVENAVGEVTIAGSVFACTPAIDGQVTTLTCPNNAPYDGMVTVADDNEEADVSFTISPCQDGSAP